ncbi:MAG TPA: hypothetical protein VMP10_04315 [Chloroflexota bacterium]|nr:hypothetical protein [Chloroflexota bacterium]
MNGKTTRWLTALVIGIAMLVAIPALAMTENDDRAGNQAAPPASSSQVKQPAPIESVEIIIQESMPPTYVARVTYGLPNGCAQPGGFTVDHQGDRIAVQVNILMPADANVACTMIYGIANYDIALGSTFTSGQTYTIQVNDQTETFTAQ